MKFIAEFCQNHQGSKDLLQRMLDAAAQAGVSHAKIQGLYSIELTSRKEFENPDSKNYRPLSSERARLSQLDLSEDDERFFVEEAIARGLTPMITVFTHVGASRAREAGFKSIKLASYDCASLSLIRRLSSWAEEIVVSTGGTAWEDVLETSRFLTELRDNGIQTAMLHARTVYPMSNSEAGLGRMLALRAISEKVGFSDHSSPAVDGLVASKTAIFLGADYVERHFTVLAPEETRDGKVSVNSVQAAELITFGHLPKAEQLNLLMSEGVECLEGISDFSLDPLSQEIENANYYRGRVASIDSHGIPVYSWEEWETLP
jgi:N,N'-diacetyllegionaminate synthase